MHGVGEGKSEAAIQRTGGSKAPRASHAGAEHSTQPTWVTSGDYGCPKQTLGGRLAQNEVQRAEGCFIYFVICWPLVVALAHMRQGPAPGASAVAALRRRTGGRGGGGLASLARGRLLSLCVVCSPGHASPGLWAASAVAYCSSPQKGGRFAALGFNHLQL